MDEAKKTYRDVETQTKKVVRDADGHDLGDDVGNAGDEARRQLGNLGDNARREVDEQQRETDDARRR
ncbi:MAG: hypothetical protein M3R57_06840 [Chloroflexota bacterium]|nr:hypothetical protein [Chloroflexota bacterium]